MVVQAMRKLFWMGLRDMKLGFYEQMILEHPAWPADISTSNWPPKMWQVWRIKR